MTLGGKAKRQSVHATGEEWLMTTSFLQYKVHRIGDSWQSGRRQANDQSGSVSRAIDGQ